MNEKAPGTALAVRSQDFMPMLEVQQAIDRRNAIVLFTQKIMVDKIDYGTIPGVDKPSLLQPGAEKLIAFFGLTPIMELVDKIEDWTGRDHGGEPLFFYRYRCTLKRGEHVLGAEEASANSWEVKYRYRWVSKDQAKDRPDFDRLTTRGGIRTMFEPDFALLKKETTGKYGKPDAHWKMFEDAIARAQGKPAPSVEPETARLANLDLGQNVVAVRTTKKMGQREYPGWAVSVNELQYRIPNPEATDVINTIMQMAEKRAKIRAVRSCTGASEFYTQDVEDMQPIEGTATAVAEPTTKAAPQAGQGPVAAPSQEGHAAGPAAAAPTEDAFYDDDGILKLKECDNIGDLTKVFNSMPVDVRRPGTKVFKAFSERREQLTPPGKKKAAAQGDAQ